MFLFSLYSLYFSLFFLSILVFNLFSYSSKFSFSSVFLKTLLQIFLINFDSGDSNSHNVVCPAAGCLTLHSVIVQLHLSSGLRIRCTAELHFSPVMLFPTFSTVLRLRIWTLRKRSCTRRGPACNSHSVYSLLRERQCIGVVD